MSYIRFFANQSFIPDEQGGLAVIAADSAGAAPLYSNDLGAALLKMLLTFAALALLLFASYRLLRHLIRNRLQKGAENPRIEILEKRMMSPKTMLYLIQVDGKQILFAESHLEIKALATLEEEKEPIPAQ